MLLLSDAFSLARLRAFHWRAALRCWTPSRPPEYYRSESVRRHRLSIQSNRECIASSQDSMWFSHIILFCFVLFCFVWVQLSNENNEALNPILDHIKKLVKYNSKYDISGTIGLERLIPFQILEYFKYPGSLTTPGCDEKVSWHVVADQVLTISEDQLLDFQTLEDSHGYPVIFLSFSLFTF